MVKQTSTETIKVRPWTKASLEKQMGYGVKSFDAVITALLEFAHPSFIERMIERAIANARETYKHNIDEATNVRLLTEDHISEVRNVIKTTMNPLDFGLPINSQLEFNILAINMLAESYASTEMTALTCTQNNKDVPNDKNSNK